MKILVVYPYIPYPLDRGTYQRSFHLLRELAREHTVDLIALSEGGERLEHISVFNEFCRTVRFVPFEHPAWPKLKDRIFNSTPSNVQHWTDPAMAQAIDETLAMETYDFVHVCDIVLAQYFLDKHKDIPLAMDRSRVDLQFQLTQQNIMTKGWRNRLLDWECIAKMWAYEKRIAKRVSVEVVCGPDDDVFVKKHISKDVAVKVIANGVDLEYFNPSSAPDAREAKPTVLFCGAMDYTPNVDALRWFFGEVHDLLLKQVPDLQVLIVGKSPIAEVLAYSKRQGVTVTGGVPDVRPYYRRAWMQIVPLRIGGGTRLKIVESLAIGTPVVSTTIGAQGLDLIHNDDILLADTAEEFVNETTRALLDEDLRGHLVRRGMETVNERLAWPMLGRALSDFYRSHFKKITPQNLETMNSVKSETPRLWAPPIAMLGVPFDNVTTEETLRIIEGMIASKRPHYLATANVDFVVQATHDLELHRILTDADLVLCDGMPLVWASRLLGNGLPERVAGSDLVPALLELAEQKGYRVFFLGGQEEVAAKALENIIAKHPNLQVAGVLSPPFKPLLEMDHEGICQTIRESEADLLFVSFGCPKQEKWINMNYRKLGVPVSIGVGATIDFLAGHMKRAPKWMHGLGLEWVYRLLQEPKRLFKRYFDDLLVFGVNMVKQVLKLRNGSHDGTGMFTLTDFETSQTIELPEVLTVKSVLQNRAKWQNLAMINKPLVIDGSKVQLTDSTGLALLTRLQKNHREADLPMVLSGASKSLQNALDLMNLSKIFNTSQNVENGQKLINELKEELPLKQNCIDTECSGSFSLQGEITAANGKSIWNLMNQMILNAEEKGHTSLVLDISSIRFVDSTGVGLMVRAKKQGRSSGVHVTFINPSSAARSVIQTLRMEKFILDESPALAA